MRKTNIIIAISLFLLIAIVVITATTVSILNEKVVYRNNDIMKIVRKGHNTPDIIVTLRNETQITVNAKNVKTVYDNEKFYAEEKNLDRMYPLDLVYVLYYYPNCHKKNKLFEYHYSEEGELKYGTLCYRN